MSFLNVYAPLFAPLQRMAELTPFLSPSFPHPEIFLILGTSIAITPSGTQEVLPIPAGRSRSSPDISFSPSSLALSCSWKVLQDLSSDHLPILLSIPLSSVLRPNERPLPSIFRKLAGMALPLTSTLTVFQQRNTRLFLFPLLLLSLHI